MKDLLNISVGDANEIFSIGIEWDVFRLKISNSTIDIKFRRKYSDTQIKFNEDGYEYKSIFVNPYNLPYLKVIELNNAGYNTPYNNLKTKKQ